MKTVYLKAAKYIDSLDYDAERHGGCCRTLIRIAGVKNVKNLKEFFGLFRPKFNTANKERIWWARYDKQSRVIALLFCCYI